MLVVYLAYRVTVGQFSLSMELTVLPLALDNPGEGDSSFFAGPLVSSDHQHGEDSGT